MVVIFGAALLLPFPKGRTLAARDVQPTPAAAEPETSAGADVGVDEDAGMWTNRVRRFARSGSLPPGKLLPDRQPAYVASWIYVFGVASLAAFGVAIVSGFALALGGPDWWHYNPVGPLLQQPAPVERRAVHGAAGHPPVGQVLDGRLARPRAWTWITGVVAFVASVVECFTGYLSQQNFDSQWISASGKDAFNSVGVGAFFNVMNFGQMLMWHIVLVPIVLVALIGAHVLLVRVRGVSHPLPATRSPRRRRARARAAPPGAGRGDAAPWRGPTRRYDILKEGTIAGVVVLALTLGLAAPAVLPGRAARSPIAVLGQGRPGRLPGHRGHRTERHQRDRHLRTAVQQRHRQRPEAAVLPADHPRRHPAAQRRPGLRAAPAGHVSPPPTRASPPPLATYRAAPAAQQLTWANAYANAVTKVKFANGAPVVPAAADGPVPVLLANELTMARSGALDADLISKQPFYGTNFTKPLLFMEDGAYFSDQAQAMGLTGEQWGVMNETGSYPGQPWLWLYTLWYQVPGWTNSANIDMIAVYMTGLATILLLGVPFIPGLRDIPR